jgi:endogenous inhibitor of DNA gyrase (YacG/DUF329 family)
MSRVCPICRNVRPTGVAGRTEHHPFCSKRCKDADLNRWFLEEHRIGDDATNGPSIIPAAPVDTSSDPIEN